MNGWNGMRSKGVLLALMVLIAGAPSLAAREIAARVDGSVSVAGVDYEVNSGLYEVDHLQPGVAEVLAQQQCGTLPRQACGLHIGPEGMLKFTGPPQVQESFSRLLLEKDVPPPTQVFQVHLLRAGDFAGEMPPLPRDAQAALEDLMQLLPYKGYRLVDSGLMRTSREGQIFLSGETQYEARLGFEGNTTSGRSLNIDFRLDVSMPVMGEGGNIAGYNSVRVLATTFGMTAGETVVVGTSKLNGGSEALVVLLSAKS